MSKFKKGDKVILFPESYFINKKFLKNSFGYINNAQILLYGMVRESERHKFLTIKSKNVGFNTINTSYDYSIEEMGGLISDWMIKKNIKKILNSN